MSTMASQITRLTVVYSTFYSDADQRMHQSPASLAFVWGIHRDRWIPRTKGQLRGKWFHLMTSSWFDDIGARSGYPEQGKAITSYSLLWDAITYHCLRYLLLARSRYPRQGQVITSYNLSGLEQDCSISRYCNFALSHLNCGMQIPIPAWYTRFWRQRPHLIVSMPSRGIVVFRGSVVNDLSTVVQKSIRKAIQAIL